MKRENLFNYDFLAQKGLSNAIERPIFQSESLNASVVAVNQVSKGVLKRGHVGVMLERNEDSLELVTVCKYVQIILQKLLVRTVSPPCYIPKYCH